LRGIDRLFRKLKEKGDVNENSYFQETDFENKSLSAAKDVLKQRELAKFRFSSAWAGI
jgi:hypothetical protein